MKYDVTLWKHDRSYLHFYFILFICFIALIYLFSLYVFDIELHLIFLDNISIQFDHFYVRCMKSTESYELHNNVVNGGTL